MKNNIAFFSHDTDAYSNGKFLILRAYYGGDKGWAMEARFWALNCVIGKSEGCRLDLKSKAKRAELVQALSLSLAELDEFLRVLRDEAELLKEDDGVYWTDQTQEDLTRAMVGRKSAAERRNKPKNDASADESKKYGDESKKYGDENHGQDRTGQDRNREDGKTEFSANSDACENSAADAFSSVSAQEVKTALAPFRSSFVEADYARFCTYLESQGLDAGFVVWAAAKAKEPGIKRPGAFLRGALSGMASYSDWPDKYRAESTPAEKAEDPEDDRADPPDVCPECGSALAETPRDFVGCRMCGAYWEYDSTWNIWQLAKEKMASAEEVAEGLASLRDVERMEK